MNYKLKTFKEKKGEKVSKTKAVRGLWVFIKTEKKFLGLALIATLVNAALTLIAPVIISHVVDTRIVAGRYDDVLLYGLLLLGLYGFAAFCSYLQTMWMGTVGQRVLFTLRSTIFNKLQTLPVAFFNQNKAGDLISRINNDTDKLNQFFSSALVQFSGNFFLIVGSGIFIVSLNPVLGGAALLPGLFILIFTLIVSPYIRRKNGLRLEANGLMSAEISESVDNFKIVVAFNRRDYFRKKFEESNQKNYKASLISGIANNTFLTPVYGFVGSAAQLIVLAYGIYLITLGQFTVGLLIGFLAYISQFYNPLRHMAALWNEFQNAMAAWDRISDILALENNLEVIPSTDVTNTAKLIEFKNVSFGYPDGKEVLHNVSLTLEHGKTYALVGPTGGGKTTTASLMARLYDATKGTIFMDGKDIRSYTQEERTRKIGFILQEAFLFTGTVRDNILYGNEEYKDFTNDQLADVLKQSQLENLLGRFDEGLDTKVAGGETMSLGQRQLIAFMRAVLRKPELLILDEATANVDTVTEQLLEDILKKLPKETTRVIIAHRLNTIESADEIYFVNSGEVTEAGSFDHAVEMLMHGKRKS